MSTKEITVSFLIDVENRRCGAACTGGEERMIVIGMVRKGIRAAGYSIMELDMTSYPETIKEKK